MKPHEDNIKKKKNKLDITSGKSNIGFDEENKLSNNNSERERMDNLCKIFNESKDSLIFNPFVKTINFNKYRPTQYRFNKNVKLPKAMSTSKEYECEIRKRQFYSAFQKYKRLTQKKRKMNVKNTNKARKQIINLDQNQVNGVESLSKRIKRGEIFITSTDKSSRFAVMSKKQYLNSVRVHTCKDKVENWSDIKYFL